MLLFSREISNLGSAADSTPSVCLLKPFAQFYPYKLQPIPSTPTHQVPVLTYARRNALKHSPPPSVTSQPLATPASQQPPVDPTDKQCSPHLLDYNLWEVEIFRCENPFLAAEVGDPLPRNLNPRKNTADQLNKRRLEHLSKMLSLQHLLSKNQLMLSPTISKSGSQRFRPGVHKMEELEASEELKRQRQCRFFQNIFGPSMSIPVNFLINFGDLVQTKLVPPECYRNVRVQTPDSLTIKRL